MHVNKRDKIIGQSLKNSPIFIGQLNNLSTVTFKRHIANDMLRNLKNKSVFKSNPNLSFLLNSPVSREKKIILDRRMFVFLFVFAIFFVFYILHRDILDFFEPCFDTFPSGQQPHVYFDCMSGNSTELGNAPKPRLKTGYTKRSFFGTPH